MAEELFLIAATEWARANASTGCDPVAFGRNVALAYLAAQATRHHAGDQVVTDLAALTRSSTPAEVQQSPAQLAAHLQCFAAAQCQTGRAGSQ